MHLAGVEARRRRGGRGHARIIACPDARTTSGVGRVARWPTDDADCAIRAPIRSRGERRSGPGSPSSSTATPPRSGRRSGPPSDGVPRRTRPHRLGRVRDQRRGRRAARRGRPRPRDPRRRGPADRWHGTGAPVQVRDRRLPADRRADRPAAGRAGWPAGRSPTRSSTRRSTRSRAADGGGRAVARARYSGIPVVAVMPDPGRATVAWSLLTALTARQDRCPPTTPPGRWTRSWPATRRRPSSPRSPCCCGPRARRRQSSAAWSARCATAPARCTVPGRAVDVVGTGGDRAHTVNISTMAALVVAGSGPSGRQARQPGRVVGLRHRPTCWRSWASPSTCRPPAWPRTVAEVGIGFCFAPVFHAGHAARRRDRGASSACRRSSTSSAR